MRLLSKEAVFSKSMYTECGVHLSISEAGFMGTLTRKCSMQYVRKDLELVKKEEKGREMYYERGKNEIQ